MFIFCLRVVWPASPAGLLGLQIVREEKPLAGQLSPSLPRLLLVDDEPDILAVCNMSLSESFDIMTFSDPRETLDYFKSHSSMYDLVLTDIKMLKQAQWVSAHQRNSRPWSGRPDPFHDDF